MTLPFDDPRGGAGPLDAGRRWWRWNPPSSPTACPGRRTSKPPAAVEAEVRAAGAVPATIAVMGGRIRIGLDDAALALAQAQGVMKLSRADLAVCLATGGPGPPRWPPP
jgi:pseudouridylate synthase